MRSSLAAPAPHAVQRQRAAALGDELERPLTRDGYGGGQGDEQACLHQRAGEQRSGQAGAPATVARAPTAKRAPSVAA